MRLRPPESAVLLLFAWACLSLNHRQVSAKGPLDSSQLFLSLCVE